MPVMSGNVPDFSLVRLHAYSYSMRSCSMGSRVCGQTEVVCLLFHPFNMGAITLGGIHCTRLTADCNLVRL